MKVVLTFSLTGTSPKSYKQVKIQCLKFCRKSVSWGLLGSWKGVKNIWCFSPTIWAWGHTQDFSLQSKISTVITDLWVFSIIAHFNLPMWVKWDSKYISHLKYYHLPKRPHGTVFRQCSSFWITTFFYDVGEVPVKVTSLFALFYSYLKKGSSLPVHLLGSSCNPRIPWTTTVFHFRPLVRNYPCRWGRRSSRWRSCCWW